MANISGMDKVIDYIRKIEDENKELKMQNVKGEITCDCQVGNECEGNSTGDICCSYSGDIQTKIIWDLKKENEIRRTLIKQMTAELREFTFLKLKLKKDIVRLENSSVEAGFELEDLKKENEELKHVIFRSKSVLSEYFDEEVKTDDIPNKIKELMIDWGELDGVVIPKLKKKLQNVACWKAGFNFSDEEDEDE